MMDTTIEIDGMTCEHCVATVRRALMKVPGVRDVKVEVGRAVVQSESPLSRESLEGAVVRAGYEPKR
jgi:copper chaperone CopZ